MQTYKTNHLIPCAYNVWSSYNYTAHKIRVSHTLFSYYRKNKDYILLCLARLWIMNCTTLCYFFDGSMDWRRLGLRTSQAICISLEKAKVGIWENTCWRLPWCIPLNALNFISPHPLVCRVISCIFILITQWWGLSCWIFKMNNHFAVPELFYEAHHESQLGCTMSLCLAKP